MNLLDLLQEAADIIRDFSDNVSASSGESSDKIFDMVLNVLFPDKD